MSPTSAARPRNPGGAHVVHISRSRRRPFVALSPRRDIELGTRTTYHLQLSPGHLRGTYSANVRACAGGGVPGRYSVFRAWCTGVSPRPVGGTRSSRRDFFLVPPSRLTHSHVSPPPSSAKSIITIINNNIVVNNNMSYRL